MYILKYCDLFGTKFHFYVGGHPCNTSIFGGIMSIIFFILAILVIIILSIDDFRKLNPISSKSEIPGGDIRIVNLHNSKIWVPWRMVTYEEKFIDHRGILHPIVSLIEGKWNSSFGMDLVYHDLKYKLCNETSMANKTDEYKIDIPLNEIFCIDNDDIPWGGSWHADILYYFEVNLYSCEGGIDFNASDPRCTKMSELLKHRNTSWLFEFYYPVVQFEPTNQEHPISVIYRSYFYRLSTYANKVERIYIQENIMEDDQSLITSSPTKKSYWGMTNVYGDSYFMPKEDEKDPLVKSVSSRLYSLVVYMDQGYVYYKRNYKNVFYIFSEVLPLVNVLLEVFRRFTCFIKLTYAKKNIAEFLFENVHPNYTNKSSIEKHYPNINKLLSPEKKPIEIKKSSINFVKIKKSIPENNCSSIVNLNIESLKNSNPNSMIDKDSNNNLHLKFNINKNGKESIESKSNINDINIIKILNKNQLKKKTEDNKNIDNNIYTFTRKNLHQLTLERNKKIVKKEIFPIYYYYMNICFDRLIKPKSFLCFNRKYFIIYNFMVKVFDISSHIKLLKSFLLFKDFFSNEFNLKKKNFINLEKRININDESKMAEIESIIDKHGSIFEKFVF